MLRRLAWVVGAGLLGALGAIAAIGRLGRDWEARVAVRGHSMEPTLLDGDWLLVDARAFERRDPKAGDLVVVPDPRDGAGQRLVVKRVSHVDDAGYLALAGDHPAHRLPGGVAQPDHILVPPGSLLGRPWLRYWPLARFGAVR
jgi:signal peptidase I